MTIHLLLDSVKCIVHVITLSLTVLYIVHVITCVTLHYMYLLSSAMCNVYHYKCYSYVICNARIYHMLLYLL